MKLATPHIRIRKFSALRSAASSERSGPCTRAITPGRTDSPSAAQRSKRELRVEAQEAARATSRPHTTSGWRASITAAPRREAGITSALADVAGAYVLVEGSVDEGKPRVCRRQLGRAPHGCQI